jgi:hypothetical protein|tara:strand:- start:65 stop:394 length:330 start_codon:yes stop_codon:yes gene_type:complete
VGRLLETRLPLATDPQVRSDIFNKLIRVLELNLGSYDTNATPAFIVSTRDEIKFNNGDLIWNLDEGVLQVWETDRWENISTPNSAGVSGTGAVGTLQITTAGSIEVAIL